MKFAHYDTNTKHLLGWYTDDVHDVIPEPNIAISEEFWQAALAIGANALDANNNLVAIDVSTQSDKDATVLAEAQEYLKSTDWYYPRQMETGTAVPADVVTKRTEARALLSNS